MKCGMQVTVLMLIVGGMLNSCSEKKDPVPVVSTEEHAVPVERPPAPAPDTVQEGSLVEYKILPHDTDSLIRKSDEPHFAFLDTRTTRKNKLLLFMGGTNTSPRYFLEFSKTAASMGFH